MEKREVDNSVGERVKAVREKNDLSRVEFAERLETNNEKIKNIELGRLKDLRPFLKLICYEFNISKEWLFYGEGDMDNTKTPLDTFSEKEVTTQNGIRLIQALLDKPVEDREEFYKFCIHLFENMKKD